MTEFKVGDIVRLTKGEPGRPGCWTQVREVSYDLTAQETIEPLSLRGYESSGWKVELIERPAPPLPTKPNTFGWAEYKGERHIVRYDAYGRWSVYGYNGKTYLVADSDLSDFTEAVFIPKDLADEVVSWRNDARRRAWLAGSILQQVADFLKGQDDE